ncbi:SAM-dependent DNA methyltransferase [halophilic archaeon]|nr:SAM-dependent DNA methyltransferase [halophilic archaeon]
MDERGGSVVERTRTAYERVASALRTDLGTERANRVARLLVVEALAAAVLGERDPDLAAALDEPGPSGERTADVSSALDAVEPDLRGFVREIRSDGIGSDATAPGADGCDRDALGRVYEALAPAERRRERGEFHTPSAVCDLVTRLTVTDADDVVLDPAAGSGRFLASAHRRLRALGTDDGRLLDRLFGVEVRAAPARLAETALALRAGDVADDERTGAAPDDANVRVADFFAVDPGDLRSDPAGFDAVVGNPPYVRQEAIGARARVRRHLARLDATDLSGRSDLSVYFLTHATEFLADGGRLGFVVSDRWLDTRYGEDVQRFVRDRYRVEAVVTFDRQAFDDALAGVTMLVLERERDDRRRAENVATFLRLRGDRPVEGVAALVERSRDPDELVVRDDYRLLARRQADLANERAWRLSFAAPPAYFDYRSAADVVGLDDVAHVSRGVTSGANEFFYARTEAFERRGVAEYAAPLLRASGQVDRIRFDDAAAAEWRVLDVHDLVATAPTAATGDSARSGEASDGPNGTRVERWLRREGHDALADYVAWGRGQGFHDRRSFDGDDVWFDLGETSPAPLLHTRFTWRTHRTVWNEADAVADQQFYEIRPDEDVDPLVLCGLLNARVTALACELLGRRAGGDGMVRLQQTVYETERVPIPDPRTFDDGERNAVRERVLSLMDAEADADADRATALDRLDEAVLSTVGMTGRADDVERALSRLVEERRRGAARASGVMLDRDRPP